MYVIAFGLVGMGQNILKWYTSKSKLCKEIHPFAHRQQTRNPMANENLVHRVVSSQKGRGEINPPQT